MSSNNYNFEYLAYDYPPQKDRKSKKDPLFSKSKSQYHKSQPIVPAPILPAPILPVPILPASNGKKSSILKAMNDVNYYNITKEIPLVKNYQPDAKIINPEPQNVQSIPQVVIPPIANPQVVMPQVAMPPIAKPRVIMAQGAKFQGAMFQGAIPPVAKFQGAMTQGVKPQVSHPMRGGCPCNRRN